MCFCTCAVKDVVGERVVHVEAWIPVHPKPRHTDTHTRKRGRRRLFNDAGTLKTD